MSSDPTSASPPKGYVSTAAVGGMHYICEECGCVVALPGNHDQHHRLTDPPWLVALNGGDAGAQSATSDEVGR